MNREVVAIKQNRHISIPFKLGTVSGVALFYAGAPRLYLLNDRTIGKTYVHFSSSGQILRPLVSGFRNEDLEKLLTEHRSTIETTIKPFADLAELFPSNP